MTFSRKGTKTGNLEVGRIIKRKEEKKKKNVIKRIPMSWHVYCPRHGLESSLDTKNTCCKRGLKDYHDVVSISLRRGYRHIVTTRTFFHFHLQISVDKI